LLNGAVQRSSAVPTSVLLVDAGLGKISALTEASDESPGSWTLQRAPSLRSALDVLATRAFDCVVVDLDLPGADAAQTWDRLRDHAPDAALLALAEHHELEHPGLALADDVLVHGDLASANARRAVLRTLRHFRLAGELRRAEESARLLSAIVDATPDAVFSTDDGGLITSWNRGAQQLYGYTAEEVTGRHVSILHPPGLDEYAPIVAVLVRGESVRGLETVRRAKDGRTVDVSITVCPVHDAAGALAGASVVARNISDRRELETELVRAFNHDGLTGLPNRALLLDRLSLADDLREALAQGLLDVHYQPIVDVAGIRLIGFEALARWHHPTRGDVPPGVFVPVAEHGGFVPELDRWVLTRACRDTTAARDEGRIPRDARVSVNLSARTLADPDLVGTVHDVLLAEGLPAQALVLEITETALMQDVATARRSLEGLRALGAGVALDDFGTGYSSLSFLRELPVTQVKIDRSFIADIVTDGEDLLITESIIDLARRLGLETVAEGVETESQLALLRRLGCASAQGHLWSRALPLDRVGSVQDCGAS